MNYAVDGFFGVAFPGPAKGENVVSVVGKCLLFSAIFLTGCATNRETVTSPPFPTSNPAQERGEYGDRIS